MHLLIEDKQKKGGNYGNKNKLPTYTFHNAGQWD